MQGLRGMYPPVWDAAMPKRLRARCSVLRHIVRALDFPEQHAAEVSLFSKQWKF